MAVNTKFVEEEFVIDVKLVEKDEKYIIIDSGAAVSLASKE